MLLSKRLFPAVLFLDFLLVSLPLLPPPFLPLPSLPSLFPPSLPSLPFLYFYFFLSLSLMGFHLFTATPLQVRDMYAREPDLMNPDFKLSQEDRAEICREAVTYFPKGKFEINEDGRRHISRTYILNAESNSPVFVKAFTCPTVPDMYIEVKERDYGLEAYTVWIIIVEDERHSVVAAEKSRPLEEEEPPRLPKEEPPHSSDNVIWDWHDIWAQMKKLKTTDLSADDIGLIDGRFQI
jgi:hypothetical protein